MALPMTFPLTRGTLGDYDGITVGVLVLQLGSPADITSTMLHVDDLTAWELPGGDYERTTVELRYDTDTGVLRYALDALPPSFDTTGTEPNAVAYYDTAGGSDGADKLLFALACEEGAGYPDWTADEPAGGLADVRVPSESGVTGTAPVVVDGNAVSLAIDPSTLAVVGGELERPDGEGPGEALRPVPSQTLGDREPGFELPRPLRTAGGKG